MTSFSEIQSLRIFIAIIDAKSIGAAARALDQSPSALSQRLKQFEEKLGVKLLQRSTRKQILTEEGELLYERGRLLLGGLDELQGDILQHHKSLTGPLKLWGPLAFGREYLATMVAEFHAAHPGLDVSLTLSDRLSANTRDRFDMVVYIGEATISNLPTYHVAPNCRFLCASPEYLKTAPTLLHPNDLLRHQCLVLRDNNEDTTLWRLNRGDDTVRIRVKPAFSTNDGDVATRWALAGKGILARSEWAVAQSIKRNELVRILPEWSLPNADVIAIVPHIDGMPARVKQFLTFLRENFRPYPKWRDEN